MPQPFFYSTSTVSLPQVSLRSMFAPTVFYSSRPGPVLAASQLHICEILLADHQLPVPWPGRVSSQEIEQRKLELEDELWMREFMGNVSFRRRDLKDLLEKEEMIMNGFLETKSNRENLFIPPPSIKKYQINSCSSSDWHRHHFSRLVLLSCRYS